MARKLISKYFIDDISNIILSYNIRDGDNHIQYKKRFLIRQIIEETDKYSNEREKFKTKFFKELEIIEIMKSLRRDLIEARYEERTKKFNGITLRCYRKFKEIKNIKNKIKINRTVKNDLIKYEKYYSFITDNHYNCKALTIIKKRCRSHAGFTGGWCWLHYRSEKPTAFTYYKHTNKHQLELLTMSEFKSF